MHGGGGKRRRRGRQRRRKKKKKRKEKWVLGGFTFVVMTHFIFEGNNKGSVNPSTAKCPFRDC
jgi:hypothetical protein